MSTKWGNSDENVIGCLICHFNRGKHTKSTGTPKLQFYVILCCLQAYDINFVSCNFVVVLLACVWCWFFFVISSVIKCKHRSHWVRDENKSSNNNKYSHNKSEWNGRFFFVLFLLVFFSFFKWEYNWNLFIRKRFAILKSAIISIGHYFRLCNTLFIVCGRPKKAYHTDFFWTEYRYDKNVVRIEHIVFSRSLR